MIALSLDHLLFQNPDGESIPLSAETISFELMGETAHSFDPELVRHAASAVLHYFKHELLRQTVSMVEFADVLDRVLRGFKLAPPAAVQWEAVPKAGECDLGSLVPGGDATWELLFFPRLREELRLRLKQGPGMLRFHGLRQCVKRLAGARRWGGRCQHLEEQIVAYLRGCLSAEAGGGPLELLIE
jgi:hypothetical protein